FGTLLENVVLDENGKPDYDNGSLTENTRAGYPIDYIPNAAIPGIGGQPKTIIFLTADAFGVLPPIAKLDKDMAMYHFVSGYTSKLAGTERGITEPVTTFSTLFGAPFFPMNASVITMSAKKLEETGPMYSVNTGWCGGAAGTVPRMIEIYLQWCLRHSPGLNEVEYELDPIFNVYIPKTCPNVPEILIPGNIWKDQGV
ncbi:MAG: phosphoenolpyruvate carboxykinase (ATP), partial [Hydrogeniiclostridium mannosilyticum]